MSRPRAATSNETRYLPVPLTEKELKDHRKALIENVEKLKELELVHASKVKAEKDSLEALETRISGYAERGQGELLACTLYEFNERQDNLADLKQKHKAKAAALKADIRASRRAITSGREFREVECVIQWDYSGKQVTTTRKDTGEVIDQRAMQPEESQERLPA